MQHKPVPIFSTGKFSKLMEDYVGEKPELRPLYNRPHKPESYLAQIAEKKTHKLNRKVLVEVLNDQYKDYDLINDYPVVYDEIEALLDDNVFTVTTGHQLCLMTGPLYFIYKIINTIRLSEELSEREKVHTIPVFWMATEDHDFEEVNHLWYGDLKYEWKRDSGNAVGRMTTDGVEEVIEQLRNVVNMNTSTEEFLALCERCYRPGRTLADATRELATALFGELGLLVIDADDARLKAQAIDIFKTDLVENHHPELLEASAKVLEDEHFTQVNPREVNLFYLDDSARYRIERNGDDFISVDGPYTWTQSEIIEELNQRPERFSPNVILRPIYQEVILPNLTYIGGGGELAYWLQLKPMFDYHKVPFPILRLRNSIGFIRRKYWHKMESLGLALEDICKPVFEQRRAYFSEKLSLNGEIGEIQQKAEDLFKEMEALAERVDVTLKGTAEAYNARQSHLIENFEKKILRAVQRREGEITRMFDEIHGEIFPSGSLQERRDSWITILERFGDEAFEMLRFEIDPFEHEFSWIIE